MSNVNLTKQLLDALKTAGVKTKKSGKRGIAVDDRTVATIYDAANGSIRAFVVVKPKLPAKLAKQFTLTKTRGYAARFTVDDDLKPLVDAIVFVAQNASDEKPAATSESTKKATTASQRASARKSTKSDDEVANEVAADVAETFLASDTKKNASKS